MASTLKFGEKNAKAPAGAVPRRSLLDLAPLELDCMNTLWPIGEGTVREIRDQLAPRRPRAYTTIMTIMDRLARKGVVERRKSGRAYIYRPNLSVEDARRQALGQVVENFFGGSSEAAASCLRNGATGDAESVKAEAPAAARAFAAAAAAGGTRKTAARAEFSAPELLSASVPASSEESRVTEDSRENEPPMMDKTLL
jgi:BlaI family penicillinase repressor